MPSLDLPRGAQLGHSGREVAQFGHLGRSVWQRPAPALITLDQYLTNKAPIDNQSFESGEVYTKMSGGANFMRSYEGYLEGNGATTTYLRGPLDRSADPLKEFHCRIKIGQSGTNTRILFNYLNFQNYWYFCYSFNVVMLICIENAAEKHRWNVAIHNTNTERLNFFQGRICDFRFVLVSPTRYECYMDGAYLWAGTIAPASVLGSGFGVGSSGNSVNTINAHKITNFDYKLQSMLPVM